MSDNKGRDASAIWGWLFVPVIVIGICLLPFVGLYFAIKWFLQSLYWREYKAWRETRRLLNTPVRTFPSFEDIQAKAFPEYDGTLPDFYKEMYDLEFVREAMLSVPYDSIPAARYRDLLRERIERYQSGEVVAAYCRILRAMILTWANHVQNCLDVEGPFTVSLLDAVPDPKLLLCDVVNLLWDEECRRLRIFQKLFDTIVQNRERMILSGALKRREPIDLSDYAGPPADLVYQYCQNTPLLSLFQGTVQFSFEDKRFQHQWVVAPSGSGKTTLLQTQICWDLNKVARGEASVVVIDSQGSGANTLVGDLVRLKCFAPGEPLHDKLVFLEPDPEAPLALNLFDMGLRDAKVSAREREMLEASAREMVAFCLSSMTEQQKDLFEYVVQFVMAIPGATIDTLIELLAPKGLERYRAYLSRVDITVQQFFATIFDSHNFQITKEAVLRRVMGMLRNPTFRKMFQNTSNKFSMLRELEAGKVIVIHTDIAFLKKEPCEIFGRFFIALLLQAAEMRPVGSLPVYCYVDEMHDYLANDQNLAILLDKARKKSIAMILAHQRLSQIVNPNVLDALSNTSIQIAGQNRTDSGALARLMRTRPDRIENQQSGSFMTYVHGQTPRAVEIAVERVMQKQPRMAERDFHNIRSIMAQRYGQIPERRGSERKPERAGANLDERETEASTEL